MIIDFGKKAHEKRKLKVVSKSNLPPEQEIKKFTDMFNEEARKNMTYDPDKDPVLIAFKEKMKRWKEY